MLLLAIVLFISPVTPNEPDIVADPVYGNGFPEGAYDALKAYDALNAVISEPNIFVVAMFYSYIVIQSFDGLNFIIHWEDVPVLFQ